MLLLKRRQCLVRSRRSFSGMDRDCWHQCRAPLRGAPPPPAAANVNTCAAVDALNATAEVVVVAASRRHHQCCCRAGYSGCKPNLNNFLSKQTQKNRRPLSSAAAALQENGRLTASAPAHGYSRPWSPRRIRRSFRDLNSSTCFPEKCSFAERGHVSCSIEKEYAPCTSIEAA